MKTVLGVLALVATFESASAQTVSFESVRLADAMLNTTWPGMEASLPLIISGFKGQLKSGGASERASEVLSEEFQRNNTKENFAKSLALLLSESFSEAELKELAAFLLSPVGQRYLRLNSDAMKSPRFVLSMFNDACLTSARRLTASEWASIASICDKVKSP